MANGEWPIGSRRAAFTLSHSQFAIERAAGARSIRNVASMSFQSYGVTAP
jgi:hypothetical protein